MQLRCNEMTTLISTYFKWKISFVDLHIKSWIQMRCNEMTTLISTYFKKLVLLIYTLDFEYKCVAMELLLLFQRIAKSSSLLILKRNNDATYYQRVSLSYFNVIVLFLQVYQLIIVLLKLTLKYQYNSIQMQQLMFFH